MGNTLIQLLKSKKTVFDVKELAILWNISNYNYLKNKIKYLVDTKKILRIRAGLFNIVGFPVDEYELANKLNSPSYISLETVLKKTGCIFQYSEEISSISRSNKNFEYFNKRYTYKKIKDSVLFNRQGLIITNNSLVASLERAFLDTIYLNKEYYFDDLSKIDWNTCFELVHIYKNIELEKRLLGYNKLYARQK